MERMGLPKDLSGAIQFLISDNSIFNWPEYYN